jgi:hypothetical protein
MSKDTLRALLVNKKEYVAHFCDTVKEYIVEDFQTCYDEMRNQHGGRGGNILMSFQDALARIPQWNHEQIHGTYSSLCQRSGCSYLGELVKAILVCYVKISVLAENKDPDNSRINLRIPSIENFMHKCYIAVARGLWKRPHLLYHNVRTLERQQNITEIEGIVTQAIRNTLRSFVPMEQLINIPNIPEGTPVRAQEPEATPVRAQESESESEASQQESEASQQESESESEASHQEPESESEASQQESESESEASQEPESESEASQQEPESESEASQQEPESESEASQQEPESESEASQEPESEAEVKTVTIGKTQGAFF